MLLNTERLELIALDPRQIELWVENVHALESELCCKYMAEPMEGIFLEIVKGQAEKTTHDPENFMWHSFWFLIRKSDRTVVGAADFKDVPNAAGEVELGYGIGKDFEHNGYMTEVAQAMCTWALEQDGVLSVIAETELNGIASQAVLRRCGFTLLSRGETLWWRLKK